MSDTKTLPRMIAPTTRETNLFATACTDTIGYQVLSETDNKIRDEIILFETCVAAGVHPFETLAVREYMSKKERNIEDRIRTIIAPIAFCWLAVGLVGVGIGIATAHWEGVIVFAMMLAMMVFASMALDYFPTYQWVSRDLYGYTKPIPIAVLEIAMRLKNANMLVTMAVHDLEKNTVVRDPLLSVRLAGAEFFVAVWDEPDFNAKYD